MGHSPRQATSEIVDQVVPHLNQQCLSKTLDASHQVQVIILFSTPEVSSIPFPGQLKSCQVDFSYIRPRER